MKRNSIFYNKRNSNAMPNKVPSGESSLVFKLNCWRIPFNLPQKKRAFSRNPIVFFFRCAKSIAIHLVRIAVLYNQLAWVFSLAFILYMALIGKKDNADHSCRRHHGQFKDAAIDSNRPQNFTSLYLHKALTANLLVFIPYKEHQPTSPICREKKDCAN